MKSHCIVRALIGVYPPQWRLEYGDELELMLARRLLTFGIVFNVLAHGVWQRLRLAPIWKLAGATLALKLVIGTTVNSIWPLPIMAYNRFFGADLLIAFAVGYLVVRRDHKGIRAAMGSAAMAATLGMIPEVVLALLWATNLIQPTILDMDGSPYIIGHGVTDLCTRGQFSSPLFILVAVPTSGVIAGTMGLIGGSISKMAGTIARRMQKEE